MCLEAKPSWVVSEDLVHVLAGLEMLPSLFPCAASSSVYRSCMLVCEVSTDGGRAGVT